MNYLGHVYLSFSDPEILLGNVSGDHYKGKLVLDTLPKRIAKGVRLHRAIDAFVDVHPAVQRAKIAFRPHYGLYSGAIVDIVFDHFLANDAKLFPSEGLLKAFTTNSYELLLRNEANFHGDFAKYFPGMQKNDWLFNYRSLAGIRKSLQGLERRAPKMPPITYAYETLLTDYYHLNQCYYDIIDDVITFVKIEWDK
jgi:acyl carrier protein phosphodiesterase